MRLRKAIRTWPYGVLSGAILGRRLLAHGSGLAGLFSPAFVGRVNTDQAGRSGLTGRFIPLPGGVLAELCGGLVALHFWPTSRLLSAASLLALSLEMVVRYRLCWQPRARQVSEALRRAVEAEAADSPDP